MPHIEPEPAADEIAGVPPLLTTRQTAAALGCSVRHVQRLAASGELPSLTHVGRHRRFDPIRVAAFLRRADTAQA